MGTPEYMSPEQLRGDEVDFRSDLYSLGVVVYELFTGALPFRGDTAVATIVKQLQEAPDLDLPALPEELRPVLARALAKNPDDRYATADEMGRALEAASGAGAGRHAGARAGRRRALLRRRHAPGAPGGVAGERADPAHGGRSGGARRARRPPRERRRSLLRPGSRAPAARRAHTGPHARLDAFTRRAVAVVSVAARPVFHPPAPRATPVPTPLPDAGPALPPADAPLAAPAPSRPPVDATRVYGEDEVDVKPRRIAGTTGPYPEWGPRLPKGKSVSITASYVVTEEGLVTDIRVERGGGVLEALLPEISRWKYEPGRKDGVPVKVRVLWKHTFIGG